MAAEAFEAVIRVAEVVEATDLNIKRPYINESCFKRISQIRFFRKRSEPRLSQEQTSKERCFELDSFASEASHVCHKKQTSKSVLN